MSKYKPTNVTELVKTVPNPEVAWAIGFIAADGYLVSHRGTDVLKIELNPKDVDALEKIRSILDFEDRPIRHFKRWNKKYQKHYEVVSLALYKKGLLDAFDRWGICNDKTENMYLPNNIPYFRDFIRGFFDGDGYILHRKDTRRNNSWRVKFGFAINSEQMREDVKEFLEYTFSATVNVSNINIEVESKKTLPLIYEYLYKDSTVYLDRKKERFSLIVDQFC